MTVALQVGVVTTGSAAAELSERRQDLIAAHMAALGHLHREGTVIMSGPLVDGPVRGVIVYRAGSLAAARALAAADPAVGAGLLAIDVAEWTCDVTGLRRP